MPHRPFEEPYFSIENEPFCEPHKELEDFQEPAKQEIVNKFERCGFCNSKLYFTHELNLSTFEVIESNRCPGCGVTAKPKKHGIH